MTRHLLDVDDLSPVELARVLELADHQPAPAVLAGRGVALLFEKPSLRTRNATEMAVFELGGHPLALRADEVGLDDREPAGDIARVLSRYHAAIAARVHGHQQLEELAAAAAVPVVNLLSDAAHPCQALADLLTLRGRFGRLEGLEVAYVGDFNNVARSLAVAAAMSGMHLRVGAPDGFGPSPEDLDRFESLGAAPMVTTDPRQAVRGADAVYTDVWTSMGQEAQIDLRLEAFRGFTVDSTLMGGAAEHAVFLHCLPAHRGQEVAAEVVDGPASLVWEQAENRLHAARGLLLWLLGA